MKQTIEIEVDVPDGWEATGEFRCLNCGDHYMPLAGRVSQWLINAPSVDAYLILRRVEPVKESRWINAYPCHHTNRSASRHETKDVAIRALGDMYGQTKVIRIDYENGKPVNVALESVEGEG